MLKSLTFLERPVVSFYHTEGKDQTAGSRFRNQTILESKKSTRCKKFIRLSPSGAGPTRNDKTQQSRSCNSEKCPSNGHDYFNGSRWSAARALLIIATHSAAIRGRMSEIEPLFHFADPIDQCRTDHPCKVRVVRRAMAVWTKSCHVLWRIRPIVGQAKNVVHLQKRFSF